MRNGLNWTGVAATVLTLISCGQPAALSVDHAWIRLPAVPGRPAAAYFTLHGGAADTTLVRVETPVAARAELHESMAGGMRPLAGVPLPAGAAVTFAPAGRHVMLFDPDPRLAAGRTAPLTLSFADSRRLTVAAHLVAAGDAAPQ